MFFSHTNSAPATSQPAVFFSHNKSAPATNHQPAERDPFNLDFLVGTRLIDG
jgi:hypothetical protein